MASNKIKYIRKLKKGIILEKDNRNKKFITNYKDIKKYFKYLPTQVSFCQSSNIALANFKVSRYQVLFPKEQ